MTAASLDSGVIRRTGQRTWEADSRSRGSSKKHRITLTLDGALLCSCEAGMNHLMCWAAKAVKEKLTMSETTTDLVPVKVAPTTAALPTERELSLIDKAAELAFRGAIALPKELNTPEKVAAVMLYGWELSLKPMTAIKHLYVVNGRVQPSAEVMAGIAQARESDIRLSVVDLSDAACTMRIVRPARGIDEKFTVTWAEIEKAGLARTEMNQKYPRDRMRWHCTKRILRTYAPDLINGMDGIPLAGGDAAGTEPAPDVSDLYNDGDAPIEGSYTEVATEPECSTKTKNAIAALYHQVRQARGDDVFKTDVRPAMQQRWPQAFLVNSNRLSALTEREGQAVVAWLEERLSAPATAETPPHEHEPQYNEDLTVMACSVCGEVLEGPDAVGATEPAAQAGLPV